MRYRVTISQVWTCSTEVEANSKREAEEKATLIAEDVHPGDGDMVFDDERIEVEPIL